jgi:hypothetical protein
MPRTFLVITSIAASSHPVLQRHAKEAAAHAMPMIVVGDLKSPAQFDLPGCDFYSVARQQAMPSELAKLLPCNHYARKNLGYLAAMRQGAEIIVETDDDNLPGHEFWQERQRQTTAHLLTGKGWVNTYRYFSERHIWPRGFALEHIRDDAPPLSDEVAVDCPMQQGLADQNPDVDALYRLTMPLPIDFDSGPNVALGKDSVCPFNSQNTTWFKDAFPLLYLPSFCSFRMTDIWRSFVAQRIAWECGWHVLFHSSTVWQERNDHNLLHDFRDEVPGYLNNSRIVNALRGLHLQAGSAGIADNMMACYQKLTEMALVAPQELPLVAAWLKDVQSIEKIAGCTERCSVLDE